jgi:hypothetical protein
MSADAIVLGLLAIADLAFLSHLRRRRRNAMRKERMMRALAIAVRREIGEIPMPQPRALAKAS